MRGRRRGQQRVAEVRSGARGKRSLMPPVSFRAPIPARSPRARRISRSARVVPENLKWKKSRLGGSGTMTLGPTQTEIVVGATVEITGGKYLGRREMVVKVTPKMVVVHRRHPAEDVRVLQTHVKLIPTAAETGEKPDKNTPTNTAAKTALPQPPRTSQNVPMNSARYFLISISRLNDFAFRLSPIKPD